MKFNSKDRTEMLKVRISEEEKTLIRANFNFLNKIIDNWYNSSI